MMKNITDEQVIELRRLLASQRSDERHALYYNRAEGALFNLCLIAFMVEEKLESMNITVTDARIDKFTELIWKEAFSNMYSTTGYK